MVKFLQTADFINQVLLYFIERFIREHKTRLVPTSQAGLVLLGSYSACPGIRDTRQRQAIGGNGDNHPERCANAMDHLIIHGQSSSQKTPHREYVGQRRPKEGKGMTLNWRHSCR